MGSLLEKVIDCFNNHLLKLRCGITDYDYNLLYSAILLLKNNIDDEKYVEYFYNNLLCTPTTILSIPPEVERMIGYTSSTSEVNLPSFIWEEIDSKELRTYKITTNSVAGYNFLYFSIPQDANFAIYDQLNNTLYNSSTAGNYEFELVGTTTTSKGKTNNVYKKKNMYNSINQVIFNISLW